MSYQFGMFYLCKNLSNQIRQNQRQYNKYYSYMGAYKSSLQNLSLINLNEWEEITMQQQQEVARFGNFCTYRNIHTQQLIDAYEIDFPSRLAYKNYLQTFKWRRSQENIVRAKYFNLYQQDAYCSEIFIGCSYIEHIKTRLSSITDIPFPQNLYVAVAMIDGYRKLSQIFGFFAVKESQVCIDQQGQIRVWVNESLEKNTPQISIDTQNIREEDMVEQILYLVSQNTDKEQQPQQNLFDFVYAAENQMTFLEAKNQIYQYAKKYQVQIPQYFESVLKIFQQNEEQECQQCESQQNGKYENQVSVPTKQYQFTSKPIQNIHQSHRQENYHNTVPYSVSYPIVNVSQPIYSHLPQYQNPTYRNPLGYLPQYSNSPHVIQYKFPKINQAPNRPIYYHQSPFIPIQQRQEIPMQKISNQPDILFHREQQNLVINTSTLVKSPSRTVDFKQVAVGSSMISGMDVSQNEKSKISQINKSITQQKSRRCSKNFQKQSQHQSINSSQHHRHSVQKNSQIQLRNTAQQMKNSSANPIIIINTQPNQQRISFLNRGQNKLCYYTAQSQQEVDPEIAADLLQLYTIF